MRIDLGRLTEQEVYDLMAQCWNLLTEEKQYLFLKSEVGVEMLEEAVESALADEG